MTSQPLTFETGGNLRSRTFAIANRLDFAPALITYGVGSGFA
jgi:hypothetical protein